MTLYNFDTPGFYDGLLRRLVQESEPKTTEDLWLLNNGDVWQKHPFPVLERFTFDPDWYDLLEKKVSVVGKVGSIADMKIDDYTVSCFHAEISCIKETDDFDGTVQLFLQVVDKNSKFGTYVKYKTFEDYEETCVKNNNNIYLPIESESPAILSCGDTVRFGLNKGGRFTFVSKDYLICKDDLNETDMNALEETIQNHGNHGFQFLSSSRKITHYVNSNYILEKSILGLANSTPLVTVQYFIDLCKALSPYSLTRLPFSEDYVPDLMESILRLSSKPVSLGINYIRQYLFAGNIFVCFTKKQFGRNKDIIVAAGGRAFYYVNCKVQSILNENKYILMEPDSPLTEPDDQIYELFTELLEKMNRRPIPEKEIGLAIILVSTKKYCNPHYNMPSVSGSPISI